jgi:xylose dehydrogenase (NAD/NADP)
MVSKILRWGFLSTARISRALIPPLRASPRNHLTAVASRTVEQAEVYAREWGIPRPYGSYEALLADPEIDVIYNPLPNHLHAEWTIRALRAGKHVLCEKPLTVVVDEVDAIIAAAQETGKIVTEAFMYRHHPQTMKVKELIDNGVVGKLRLVRGSFSYLLDEPNIRLDSTMGGGCVYDIGCYPVSYARYVLGCEPSHVFGWQVTGPTGVDLTFAGQLKFPGNLYMQFDCSFQASYRSSMEFIGTEGTLVVPHPFKPGEDEKVFLVQDQHQQEFKIRGLELYRGEVEDMADAVLLGKPPRICLADSRANMVVLQALLHSARQGQTVEL